MKQPKKGRRERHPGPQMCPACAIRVPDLMVHNLSVHRTRNPVTSMRSSAQPTARVLLRSLDPLSLKVRQHEIWDADEPRPGSSDQTKKQSTQPALEATVGTTSCRCDGSNENCAYCFGTGTVETDWTTLPPVPKAGLIPCPTCGVLIAPKNAKRHRNKHKMQHSRTG